MSLDELILFRGNPFLLEGAPASVFGRVDLYYMGSTNYSGAILVQGHGQKKDGGDPMRLFLLAVGLVTRSASHALNETCDEFGLGDSDSFLSLKLQHRGQRAAQTPKIGSPPVVTSTNPIH